MLPIHIKGGDYFVEDTSSFVHVNEQDIQLEHSLISISKWEQKYKKPFISKEPKTEEEMIEYYKCMVVTPNANLRAIEFLPKFIKARINAYIDDPMTATTINEKKPEGYAKSNSQFTTNELIYSWMAANQIPFRPCETWHLNRLLTLIRVCNDNNTPKDKKKMNKADTVNKYAAMNRARRMATGSKG